MNYYDVMASVPTLSMGAPPPLSPATFMRSCEGRMTTRDGREFQAFAAGEFDACRTAFARKWAGFENTLTRKLADLRATRWELDAGSYAYLQDGGGDETYIDHIIAEATAKSNPRQRERVLDRARWQELDNLIVQTPFGLAAVLATFVKLRIMTRWYAIHRDKGARRLAAVMDGLLPDRAGAAP